MSKILSTLLFCLLSFGAQAQSLKQQCENAGWADAGTTLGGLALGAVEANPLGPLALVTKPVMLEYIKTLPEEERAEWYASCAATWGAAAANNVCIIGALATGGALTPVCPMVGLAYYFHSMEQSAQELEFWVICGNLKRGYAIEHPEGPEMTCTYTPPVKEEVPPIRAIDIPRISE